LVVAKDRSSLVPSAGLRLRLAYPAFGLKGHNIIV
jgi:hypothetical protein